MNEGKTALSRMGVYYSLLAINIIPCANVIADRFPARNLSTVYLLILCVCLVLYYARRVPPAGSLSVLTKALSWMALLLILLRGVKYSAVAEVSAWARHTWYLYYVPLLLLPLFLFHISLLVPAGKRTRTSGLQYGTLLLTVLLIGLVLTNDLHQQAFRFQPGFADWDHEYSRGWLFYAATFWQYALYAAAILLLVAKCRVGSAKRFAWLLLIPFAIGIAMNILLLTDTMPRLYGTHLVEFPEALICMAAAVLEGCFQLGLIPTNTNYGKLFSLFSISAQITDQAGAVLYASRSASAMTPEQFAMESGTRIDEHTVLHRMPVPGGFGFWQDDLSELDRLNEKLAEAKELLSQEAALTRLQSEMKERQAKIDQRTKVYDAIAMRTRPQAQAIVQLAKTARLSGDAALKDVYRNRITLLGAYIKRYANLMLLSRENGVVNAGELGLSVSELLRCLNNCGVPGELICDADCAVPAEAALAIFEALATLPGMELSSLQGVFVHLSAQEGLTCKITLEGLPGLFSPFPENAKETDDWIDKLRAAGVAAKAQREDDALFLSLSLRKGGESA
ncbi:MAG: histidine kinase N-terminal 7TM domain-containing protein [Oscillospiraceae bacterium]|nr:histidine kinase N-terminal 7TM domain-containing protein [Oscillospiraceae bacterium]